ncbi:MAG: hypothetical protein FJY88_00885 [Candidatus Eisenbacteria bacterium]|nr:hypothetical protein [Candidatus Eisenbacteria bacterium]
MRRALILCLSVTAMLAAPAAAGVVNPDISVIGQPFLSISDQPEDPDRNRLKAAAGETEIVLDAYLNPYAKGYFTLAIGEEGAELEEGYFSVLRGLPLGLNLKGGKYRVGFGKMNPLHPHTYPFAEPLTVLTTYLPGEESFNDVGISLSARIPLFGDAGLTAALDYLDGQSFRVERAPGDTLDPLLTDTGDKQELTRPGVAARLSGFAPLGERSGIEFGISAAGGTNNVAARARTEVYGADLKAKLWNSSRSYLVIQGEVIALDREQATWRPEAGYAKTAVTPTGGYLFADYNFGLRYNAGISYESYQEPNVEEGWSRALGIFAGYAVMEETLLFRLVYQRLEPDAGEPENSARLHVIFSMGPHKAHQF